MSERKHSEWSEALLWSVANSSPLGFFAVDNRTDAILYFNHLFCAIWDIQRLEEKVGRGELKNSDVIPDCLPLVKDVPAFVESCKALPSEVALRKSEEQLRLVTDALPVCIAYADSEQRYQFNNKTYKE